MNILQNLKDYFKKKENNQATDAAPVGVCPNCWGKQEWDGEFYKLMKAQNGTSNEEVYTNFIQDIAKKLDKITLKTDTYTCETCKMSYKDKH